MPSPQDREELLIAFALERPADLRPAFLDAVCAGDPALRQRLEALLAASGKADDLLPPAASPLKATVKLELENVEDEAVGTTIGRYKLLERIGEGGCGVVYVAEQTQPVRRRVALKVIKLGMDTRQVIARFEAERQALALMDHPNIAKVFDGGTTDTGRPYFVMELVRGIKITDYCDKNNVSTEERLNLFVKVCHAVQHAHQKGVIHRDIKPSNVLVTLHDTLPVPKMIDFGIAKATTDQRLTDKTIYTALEQFIGTPAYMSPEQAEMSGLDIDTRSDIYSLGVLLYELLTSRTPFDAAALMKAGLDQMRRVIREREPERPSTRLRALKESDLTTVARQRHTEAPKLLNRIRGDLDWIVMKSLEKDRTRRYETANGFAMDVQRHLSNEPVIARPPGGGYRLQKLVRRNKVACAAAAAVLIALMLGLVGTMSMYVKAQSARRKAASEAAIAEAVNSFLQEDILKQASSQVSYAWRQKFDTPLTVKEALDRADKQVENRFKDQPLVGAAIHHVIGSAYVNVGQPEAGITHLLRAYNVRKGLLGPKHADVLESAQELAGAYAYTESYTNAFRLLEEILTVKDKVLGPDNRSTLDTRVDEAEIRFGWKPSAENLVALERVYNVVKEKLPRDDPLIAECASWLVWAYKSKNRLNEAISLQQGLLAQTKERFGASHPSTLNETRALADCYQAAGRLPESIDLLKQAAKISENIFGDDRSETRNVMGQLGQAYADCGRATNALELFQSMLAHNQPALPPSNPFILYLRFKIAWCYMQLHRQAEGTQIMEEVLRLQLATLGSNHVDVYWTMGDLASAYHDAGRSDDAIPLYEKALSFKDVEIGRNDLHLQWLNLRLLDAYAQSARLADAVALFKARIDPLTNRMFAENSDNLPLTRSIQNAAQRRKMAGQTNQSIRLCEQAVELCKVNLGESHPETWAIMDELGRRYFDAGLTTNALVVYENCLASRMSKLPQNHLDILKLRNQIANCYFALGRSGDGIRLREEVYRSATATLGTNHIETH